MMPFKHSAPIPTAHTIYLTTDGSMYVYSKLDGLEGFEGFEGFSVH